MRIVNDVVGIGMTADATAYKAVIDQVKHHRDSMSSVEWSGDVDFGDDCDVWLLLS